MKKEREMLPPIFLKGCIPVIRKFCKVPGDISSFFLTYIITRGRKLILRIPKIKTLSSKYGIWDYQIGLLQQMGFQWNSKETLFYLELEPSNSTKQVMECLSRIVFKVFTFEEMKGKSYISYR